MKIMRNGCRYRSVNETCDTCGRSMIAVYEPILVAEDTDPVGWSMVSVRCSNPAFSGFGNCLC